MRPMKKTAIGMSSSTNSVSCHEMTKSVMR